MNKIYKVIFNRNKNRYEIVSELASSRGGKCKVKAGKQIGKLFMTGLLATFLSSVALAADEDVKVKYDAATGTIKIFKADESQVLASYAVGGNISSIDSLGTDPKTSETIYPSGVIAIGKDSKAVQTNNIAIGTDAHAGNVNGKDNISGKIAIGTKTVASGDRSIALGNYSSENEGSYNIVQGNDSIGIGTSTSIFGSSGVSIGRRNIIGVPDPDLVNNGVLTTKSKTKYGENDLGGNSVIVGAYNVAYGNRSNIIGTYSRAMGSNSVAIGSGVQSLSDGSIAIGKGSGYEFEDASRSAKRNDNDENYYGRDWELPPEYKVLKQVLLTDIAGDKTDTRTSSRKKGYFEHKDQPKYNNYGAGSSDPGGFIVEGKNALGIGTYTQVRGDSAIGLATGEMTADLSEKDKSQYARDMRKIMDMEETLYDAKEALQAGTGDTATLESAVKAAEESLATAKKNFRETYLKKYSFVDGNGALGVGRQILAQGDRSMAVGDYAKAISNDAIAYGGQTLANGTNSMAMGGSAHVGTEKDAFANSMAIGSHTDVQAGNAVALGAFSEVTGTNSLALGFGTQSSTDSNSITYNSVSGHDSTLIGSYGNIAGNNSILIGSSGSIANDRVVGLGNNIKIKAADQNDQENNTAGSVFLGDHAGYVKDSKRSRSLGQVDVVGSAGKMELTESLSSTKGALRDYTKDFIYIYMLERQDDGTQIGAPIAVRSDFAGGDSTVGVVSVGSTYEQTFENLDKIKEHHKKVGSLITVPVEVTVQVTKNGISLGEQKQTRYFAADATQEQINSDSTLSDEDKKKVWDTIQESRKKADTKYTVFETRRIQNVAPGLIGVNSTDAINGSQLFATNQMLGNLVGSLKKTFGDNVTITEDGQIKVSGGTLGWIAKAKAADGSNGTVNYQVGKDDKITKDDLEKKGSAIEAADQLIFQAGKNIGLVQTPDTLTISTIDTPSFKSVELRGDEKTVDGKKVTEVTKIDSSGMKVVTETSTPASDGSTTPTVTEKVSTTVGKDGVSTDGSVKVTNGKTGDDAKDLVTIGKNVDPDAPAGTDGENGTIGLDGKNGSSATITVDRGTSSLDNTKNIGGTNPEQDIGENNPAKMDRITYTTKNKDDKDVITHEVATMDDGLFFSGDSADGVESNGVDANTFGRKLSQETKIVGGVNLGLTDSASAKERQEAIAAKLTDGNIGVISDGTDTLTVKLAKQLTGLDSTTYTSPTTKTDDGEATSTMKVDGNGIRFVGDKDTVKNDAPSLTADGITGGNKTITDVASGIGGKVEDPDKNNANTFLENVNKIGKKDGDQPAADAISENVVVNAKDLKNLVDTGFKLNTSGQGTAGASTVKIGDTIKVVDGANTKVSAIDDSTTGTYTFHIDVTGMPISYTDNQGNALTKIGDKYYKNTDIENGKPKTNATEVPADEVTNNIKVINKDGTTNNQGTISNVKSVFDSNIGNGADIGSKVDEIKDGSVISNTGSNQFINDLTKLNDQVDPKATDAEAEKIRAKKDEEKLNSVSTVRDLQKVALTPLFFEGDVAQDAQTANTFGRKLSEKTKIVGEVKDGLEKEDATAEEKAEAIRAKLSDGNVGVVSNGTDTLTIKLAKNLVNLTSVETGSGNNKTKMTENGITTTVKDGDTFKVTTTTPNGLATTEVKLDSEGMPKGESTTTMVTTDGVTITTQTPKNGDKPASTTETKLSKDGLATDGTVKVTNGKDGKDLVTIGKGTETDPNATDKEFGTVAIDGKNGSNATLTVDRGTKSVTDSANVGKDPTKPIDEDNPVAGMDRLTYTTTGPNNETINHEVATLDDGFMLTTSTDVANSKAPANVKLNHTIKFTDGANTKVSTVTSKDGVHELHVDVTGLPVTYTASVVDDQGNPTNTQNVSKVGDTYQLEDGTKLVKSGDKYYKLDQIENGVPKAGEKGLTIDNSIRVINPEDPSKTAKITNVAPGEADTDAVNMSQLKQKAAAATTEVTGTGAAEVTKVTGANGQNIYNVHVDKLMTVKAVDSATQVARGSDGKYYNADDIAGKTFVPSENKWYNTADVDATTGKPLEGKSALANQPLALDQSKLKNSVVNPNGDGATIVDNVKSGIGGEAGNGIQNGTTIDGTTGNNTFIKNLDKVGKPASEGGIDKTTVVNAGDLKNLADTPLFFSGDSADGVAAADGTDKNTFARKLSQETKIVGGVDLGLQADATAEQRKAAIADKLTDGNIGVISDGTDTLTVKLAKNLVNLTSVETGSGDNKTKMTENGVTTTVKDGDTFKVTTTTPNGLATTEVKLDSNKMPTGESKTTTVTTDGVTITTQTPKNGGKPASTTETKLSKDGLATDGTVKVTNGKTGDDAKDLVTIGKGTETDPNATDKEFGTVAIDGKNGSNATLTVDRGTKSVTDSANVGKDPTKPIDEDNPVAGMDRLTYTTTGPNNETINHEVATLDDGFMLTTSTDVANSKAPANVKLNHTIKFTDGANTKVSTVTSKDGVHELHVDVTGLPVTYTASVVDDQGNPTNTQNVSKVGDTYQLEDGTKLVKVDGKYYKPDQLDNGTPKSDVKGLTIDNSIRVINPEDPSKTAKITNVAPGEADTDAVNMSQLKQKAAAATTEVTGTGAAEVTKTTGADGQNIYNVHVERFMQVAETDVEGNKVVKATDNHYYKEADIKDKTYIDGKWYNNTDIKDKTKIGDKWYSNTEITDGKANPNATELTVQATAPNKAVGLQNNLVNPNDNTPTRLSNLASALSGEVGNGANTEDNSAINGIDKNGKPTSEPGSNTFVKNVLDLDATEKTVEQLKTSLGHEPSEDEVKAEKARAEKDKALLNSAVTVADLQKTLQSPLFFEGDSADGVANENDSDKNTFARKLSQKTKIVGGVDLGLKENATAEDRKKAIAEKLSDNNIGVVSNGTDTLTIKLAKNLVNLTSVETGSGNNKTKMTENGITTTVKDGDTFKVTTTTPNGLATTEVKLDSEGMPKGESTTTMVTTDGVTITTQTPPDPDGDKPASTTETKLSKDGLATDGTIKVTGDNAKDLVTIAKGTDGSGTDKEYGKIGLDGKNGSNATLTVDRGTKSVTDKANILKDPKQPAGDNNPVSMDRLTYTTTGIGDKTIEHQVATLDDGFFLTTEHTEADKTRTVLFNNTIKVLDGANTKVSAMGGEKGTHTFHIDVTGLPVTYTATKTDANGAPTGEPVDVSKVGDGYQLADGTKLVKVDDKYYKPEQLENNKPKPGEEGLTIKQSVSLVQDNGAPATLERVGSGRRNGMNAKDTPMDWNSILNAAADNAEVNNMLTNAANIGDVRDAIKSITNGTDGNAIGGFGLTGNNGEVKQDLGKTITIKGGIETKHDAATNKDVPAKSTTDKNTYVNVKDVPNADGNGTHKEMVIEIAKDLTDLDSVTVGSVDPTTGKGETTKITGKDVTIKDKAGNANTSTATKDELTNANGDKTTVEAGKVDVSKKNADGTTSNTNIDGSKITLENKDKDSNTVGSKTDIGTDGIRITYKDDKGKTDPKKDVSLTDKGLNNGGNQIKNVGSGLVDKNGKDITDISNITDSDILSNGVNVGDLKQAINSVTNSSNGGGFGLKGNNGKIMQNLGETITIKGGIANKKDDSGKDLPAKSTTAQNTYVNVKDSEMIVEIAKDLTDLDSVTVGSDKDGKGETTKITGKDVTIKDKAGNTNTSTASNNKLTNANGDKTTVEAGNVNVSKKDKDGNTNSTNIDGSTITLENKDKDGKTTVGSKTDIGTDGIRITYKDDKGKTDPKKDVSLTDKGLNNGGNQIKNVGSGLVDKNGKDITDISNIADSDILSNGVNVKDLQSVNKKLKDDIINISNQVDDIKNSAPVVYVYTDKNGKRVSKQGDKFVNEDGTPVPPDEIEIKLSLVNADGKTTNPSTLQNVAKGVQDTDAVNVKQLTDATEKPLTFNGDAGSSSAKLGETVAIKGGANSADLTDNNIGVIANSSTKTLNVKLSKKLKGLESAEFVDNNGNTTNITGDGVHISGGNGSNVSLTSQGLNNGGNRITNVAPGVEATDAVNVSQLNQVGAALHNRINNVAKGAYGGVASAGAMASLPQAYLPGKSMVAAGASHYRGESAVALGASRISDNGKIILKLNASHNTSGNTMVGAGVGYQF
ncbi:YadA-like family protein [Gallibacterium anatis]|uniref:YadA-like family protein n=1 Tax=Gallibacterium anatis TaxID=750 RepID=UPI0038D4C455